MDLIKSNAELARSGDKAAFENLINENMLCLYKVARGILKKDEDIQDALQETIFKAYKNISYLKDPDLFRTWLIRILINECKNILKRNKKIIYLDEDKAKDINTLDNLSELEIREIINFLEYDLRIVTVLYYYKDFSQKEIAKMLRLPYGTVRSRLSRARQRLQQLINIE